MASFAAPPAGCRSDRGVQAAFRRDGVVHLRGALDAGTLCLVRELWQRSIGEVGRPSGYRIPPVTTESGQILPEPEPIAMGVTLDAARQAAAGGQQGLFYGVDVDTSMYRPLAACAPIVDLLACLFEAEGGGAAHIWSLGAQLFLGSLLPCFA